MPKLSDLPLQSELSFGMIKCLPEEKWRWLVLPPNKWTYFSTPDRQNQSLMESRDEGDVTGFGEALARWTDIPAEKPLSWYMVMVTDSDRVVLVKRLDTGETWTL